VRRAAAIAIVLMGCPPAVSTPPPKPGPEATVTANRARVNVHGKKANGAVFITALGGAIKVQGSVQGLAPKSSFGLHVHDRSDCKAAGDDFNPAGNPHAGPAEAQSHAGDLGNITAAADGQAVLSLVKPGVRLDNGPRGILGRILVVHERLDDYKTQPEGDAGAVIACGVIAPE
jgi:Cu-Zn family superoxide dismutase